MEYLFINKQAWCDAGNYLINKVDRKECKEFMGQCIIVGLICECVYKS